MKDEHSRAEGRLQDHLRRLAEITSDPEAFVPTRRRQLEEERHRLALRHNRLRPEWDTLPPESELPLRMQQSVLHQQSVLKLQSSLPSTEEKVMADMDETRMQDEGECHSPPSSSSPLLVILRNRHPPAPLSRTTHSRGGDGCC